MVMMKTFVLFKDEQEFAVDQVGYYVEDLLLEARTGGEDEDLEDLEDDELSFSIMDAFQYKVITKCFLSEIQVKY